MPRKARVLSFTKIYHIMIRGINKSIIFYDKNDYAKMLKILRETKEKYNFEIYGYCLMKNHVHLVIKDSEDAVSNIMKSINISYALYFNKKYNRVGHVFQNRFRSKNVLDQKYLMDLIRYVHRNPEKADICRLEEYKWSSYKYYFNKRVKFVNTQDILRLFENNLSKFERFHTLKNTNFKNEIEFEFVDKLEDKEAKIVFQNELGIKKIEEIKSYNIEIRNNFIKQLKAMEFFPMSQISRILGVSRKVVERL